MGASSMATTSYLMKLFKNVPVVALGVFDWLLIYSPRDIGCFV